MTADVATGTDKADKAGSNVPRLILLGLLVVAVVVAALFVPVGEWMNAFLDWVADRGVWAPIFVAGFYIVACLFALPGSILTLGAGAALGVVVGTIAVSIGSTLGAAAAFCVGRFIARDWVAARVARRPRFAAIDEAVGREGFRIVLLTRLSPIFPFNLLNYGYGLTKVPLWKYFVASWIGMFPATVMYVYIGSLAKAAAEREEMAAGRQILYIVGLVATVAVTVLIARIARRALKRAVRTNVAPAAGEGADA